MQKVIVTGGAGFIGSHTVVELAEKGFEPVIIDNFANSDPKVIDRINDILGRKITHYQADCLDKKAMEDIFEKEGHIQGVIHFAAYKAVGESVREPLKYYENNIQSLVVLLETMNRFGVRDIVFSSSCTVYGQPDTLPVTEESPVKPATSPYGFTKQVCEQILQDQLASGAGLRAIVLRYFNPIGAHPTGRIGELPIGKPENLVPFVTQTAIGLRDQLRINGQDYNTADGTCIRDYIHVVDLADAHVHALQWAENQNSDSLIEIFNIGTGRGNSVTEVVQAFEKATGVKLNYMYGPRRPGDVEQVYAGVEKANTQLGWKPKYSLEDALLHAWNWEKFLAKGNGSGTVEQ
jgi:UDP-glucose 4-epimerase